MQRHRPAFNRGSAKHVRGGRVHRNRV